MQCRRHLDYCSTAGFGLRSILMTSLGGMGMGLCAQAGYDWIQEWRRRKAIEIYLEDIQGKKTSLFENWTLVSQSQLLMRTPINGWDTSISMHVYV